MIFTIQFSIFHQYKNIIFKKDKSTKKLRMTSSVSTCLSKLAKEEEAFDNHVKHVKGLFQVQRESLNQAIE